MDVKVFERLPKEAKIIRTQVFIKEQGFQNEFDEIDMLARHIVIFENDNPIATCRVYYSQEKQCYVIGRIAVQKGFRGKKLGNKLIEAAEKEIIAMNGSTAFLSAQVRVAGFYEKNGYRMRGETYLDEGCPHVWMEKKLN